MKLMLISWVLVVAMFLVTRVVYASLSDEEVAHHCLYDEYPKRVRVVAVLLTLSVILAIIATIMAIIRW